MKNFRLEDFLEHNEKEAIVTSLYNGHSMDFSISYASDFKNAKILREITDYTCILINICPKWRTRIVLVVDELNNNAIEYGSAHGDENIFEFHAKKTDKNDMLVTLSVADSGKWKYAKKAEVMEDLRKKHNSKNFSQHHGIRGRGLFLIISKLVDVLKFDNNSHSWLRVTIEKRLQLKEEEYC